MDRADIAKELIALAKEFGESRVASGDYFSAIQTIHDALMDLDVVNHDVNHHKMTGTLDDLSPADRKRVIKLARDLDSRIGHVRNIVNDMGNIVTEINDYIPL